ncbi:hypothetical protein CASFOL_008703 [Castilleja foliolosa]|uniref:mRNA (guanine-N(7))-methyltransferase n=1 Tax=Castilleja foliolosa TaxID=1961234 RepID=A0ABD3DZQ8_9LAMI
MKERGLSAAYAKEMERYSAKESLLLACDGQFLEDETTKIFAKKVADHYSARTNQTLEEREASPIIHLKKLNNWYQQIKSVLIQLYAKRGDAVLDTPKLRSSLFYYKRG